MSDSKTFVFPDGGGNNGMLGFLAPLLQRTGLDPNMVFAMMNNRGNSGFGGEGGWFIWVIFLFFLMGCGGNGFGGFGGNRGVGGLENFINNDAGRELLMSLIQGNGNAINQLAATLNCDVNAIQAALNNLQTQLCNIGNQIGMSGQQIINAIQAGDCNIAQQIASCCCELKSAINGINTGLERGFSSIAFETQRQTCDITKSIENSTAQILAGQRAAEMREMQREIAERDRRIAEQAVVINNGQQTAIFGQMITQATTPIAQAVGALQNDVNGIKCKLPNTVPVPYPQLQAYNPEIYRAAAAGAFAGDVAFSRSGNGCSGYWG